MAVLEPAMHLRDKTLWLWRDLNSHYRDRRAGMLPTARGLNRLTDRAMHYTLPHWFPDDIAFLEGIGEIALGILGDDEELANAG